MREWVAVVDENGIQSRHSRPASDRRDDRLAFADDGFALDAALEQGADDRFVDELVAGLKLALGVELSHARRGAGAAGRAVDGLVAVEHGVARMRFGMPGRAG